MSKMLIFLLLITVAVTIAQEESAGGHERDGIETERKEGEDEGEAKNGEKTPSSPESEDFDNENPELNKNCESNDSSESKEYSASNEEYSLEDDENKMSDNPKTLELLGYYYLVPMEAQAFSPVEYEVPLVYET